jgi:hypothetical protein
MEAHTFPYHYPYGSPELTIAQLLGAMTFREKCIVQSDWFMSLCIDVMFISFGFNIVMMVLLFVG